MEESVEEAGDKLPTDSQVQVRGQEWRSVSMLNPSTQRWDHHVAHDTFVYSTVLHFPCSTDLMKQMAGVEE